MLRDTRAVDGRGIELSQSGVNECVAKGLSVIQGDADADLVDYPDDSFDSSSCRRPCRRRGGRASFSSRCCGSANARSFRFPNFGHWRVRWQLLAHGRMPVTENLSYSWYDTPNIHFCTIDDFVALVREIGAKIEFGAALSVLGASAAMKCRGVAEFAGRAGGVSAAAAVGGG